MAVMAIGFLAGLAILLYPLFANMWNSYNEKLKFQQYTTVEQEKFKDETLTGEWEKAIAYNNELQPIIIPDSFIQAEQKKLEDTVYMECLNPDGDGKMGYLSIPKIGEVVPIYHTTDETVLQRGAGHIHGSSLPVGGEGTHASIAAHRGLPGSSLFTDIDQLESGDQFYLYILDDILAYEVDQILTVEPADTEALNVEPGRDYVTLVTCTPYGVNTQRLLVRGHRVPYEEEKEMEEAQKEVHSIHTNYGAWIAIGIGATALCLGMLELILLLTRRRKKRSSGAFLALFFPLCLMLCLRTVPVWAQSPGAWGADAGDTGMVDTQKNCKITLKMPAAFRSELEDVEISVRLYHIADIAEDGSYIDKQGYESLELSSLTAYSPAGELKDKAEQTAEFLQADNWTTAVAHGGDKSPAVPDREFLVKNNKGMQTDMTPGLYLVSVKPIQVAEYQYEALPYIISLPSLLEGEGEDGYPKQIWSTDCVVDLKLARASAGINPPDDPPDVPNPPDDPPDTPNPPDVTPDTPNPPDNTPDKPDPTPGVLVPLQPTPETPGVNTSPTGEITTGDVLGLQYFLWGMGFLGVFLILSAILYKCLRRRDL